MLYVTVEFKITEAADDRLATDVKKEEIVVEEDGQRVNELTIHQPKAADPLTAVLVLDVSGSMSDGGKIDAAKRAAELFLDTLHPGADCGLVLFDHRIKEAVPPAGKQDRLASHRQGLRTRIRAATPDGGTAYLDATAAAIEMLQGVKGRRAILLMTDGVDLNSKHTLDDVIKLADLAQTPIYVLGVGEPGKKEPVSTVLVLDKSGSMIAPAERNSTTPKIVALRQAADRFLDLMRPGARISLLPFSTRPDPAGPFQTNKSVLKQHIRKLRPEGETALFDAIYDGIETLVAARHDGRLSVVALTDGIDNTSRRRVEEVVARAKEVEIPVHMLGFGRSGELDEKTMATLAKATGGQYYHAENEQKLTQIFERLSIQLHDDGIDEEALTRLAKETGGKYFHSSDLADLPRYYRGLAEELQTTYTITFPSRRQTHDGSTRQIEISVVRNGVRLSDVASAAYHVHGVVVPKLDRHVYLILLAAIGGLLAVPAAFRRWTRRPARA